MVGRTALLLAIGVSTLFFTGTLGTSPTPPPFTPCQACCRRGGNCPPPCLPCPIIDPAPPCSGICPGRCILRNGRYVCLPPIIPDPYVKPGQCPINDLLPRIFCAPNSPDQCSSDRQCPGAQKCCSYGCAKRCTAACNPPCRRKRICRLQATTPCRGLSCIPLPGRETAVCEPRRSLCRGVQCPAGQRCRVRAGVGTCVPIVHKGVCPASTVRLCPAILRPDQCQSDASCPRGQKCCRYNCERKCLPACRRPCRPGETCQLETFATCLAIGCPPPPPPRAVCKPSQSSPVRTGVCPKNDIITTCQVREDACTSDAACAPAERCCSRGCGRQCLPVCSRQCPPSQECVLVDTGIRCVRAPCPSQKAVCRYRNSIKPIG